MVVKLSKPLGFIFVPPINPASAKDAKSLFRKFHHSKVWIRIELSICVVNVSPDLHYHYFIEKLTGGKLLQVGDLAIECIGVTSISVAESIQLACVVESSSRILTGR
jgi:hypothetical protein